MDTNAEKLPNSPSPLNSSNEMTVSHPMSKCLKAIKEMLWWCGVVVFISVYQT